MADDATLTAPDGRTIGYLDLGPADGTPVIDCHGGPGNRDEPRQFAGAADAGIRLIGIDRPGYGRSTPLPGRSIGSWVEDCLLVADHLGIDGFGLVGASTGGAFALAVAAAVPDRALGALLVCSTTDMRHAPSRALARGSGGAMTEIWAAPDRDAALAIALDYWGEDGTAVRTRAPDPDTRPLAGADIAHFIERAGRGELDESQSFTFGVQGYTDDRIADGAGWGSFDLGEVRCPVTILHGEDDSIAPPALARRNHELLPHATLRVLPGHGHLTIFSEVTTHLVELLEGARDGA